MPSKGSHIHMNDQEINLLQEKVTMIFQILDTHKGSHVAIKSYGKK